MVVRIDDPQRGDPEVVRAVLAGRSQAFAVPAALALVRELALPADEQEALVGDVLSSATDPTIRSVASITLRRLATDGARDRLVGALTDEAEARVVGDIALALGFVGDHDDIPLLLQKAAQTTDPFAEERIRFAAGLIAHRLGLDAPHLDFPPSEVRLQVDDPRLSIRAREAHTNEVDAALDELRAEPLGFTTERDMVHALECGPRTLFVALNRDVVADFGQLAERKTLPGAVMTFSEEDQRATPAMLLLSDRADNGFDLLVTRLTGEPLYRGTGWVDGQGARGRVWSIDTIGVAALDLEVAIEGRTLSADGTSEATIRKQREPRRIE